MLASHLVEINELTPAQLCNYIEHKQYIPLKECMLAICNSLEELKASNLQQEKITLLEMLFSRLKSEMEQIIRNDTLVVFPIIRQAGTMQVSAAPHLPVELIKQKNKKIIAIVEKMRQLANNYVLQSEWDNRSRMFFEELFELDQLITQSIYMKENVLFQRLKVE